MSALNNYKVNFYVTDSNNTKFYFSGNNWSTTSSPLDFTTQCKKKKCAFYTSNGDSILISGSSTNPEISIEKCTVNWSNYFLNSACGMVSQCYEACWTTTIDENTYTLSNSINGITYSLCVNTDTGSSTLLQQGESEQGVICNLQITKIEKVKIEKK